jgi:hypothetical protein
MNVKNMRLLFRRTPDTNEHMQDFQTEIAINQRNVNAPRESTDVSMVEVE